MHVSQRLLQKAREGAPVLTIGQNEVGALAETIRQHALDRGEDDVPIAEIVYSLTRGQVTMFGRPIRVLNS